MSEIVQINFFCKYHKTGTTWKIKYFFYIKSQAHLHAHIYIYLKIQKTFSYKYKLCSTCISMLYIGFQKKNYDIKKIPIEFSTFLLGIPYYIGPTFPLATFKIGQNFKKAKFCWVSLFRLHKIQFPYEFLSTVGFFLNSY